MAKGFLSLDCIPRKRRPEEVTHLWEEGKAEGIARLWDRNKLGSLRPCCELPYVKASMARNWCLQPTTSKHLMPATAMWVRLEESLSLLSFKRTTAPADSATAISWQTLTQRLSGAQSPDPQKLKDNKCCCPKLLNGRVICYTAW